jgi:hypothetical protein
MTGILRESRDEHDENDELDRLLDGGVCRLVFSG